MTLEEFLTIITQIEGILNSKPITPLSEAIDDLEVLTPGHFLIGRPITSISEPNLRDRTTQWNRPDRVRLYLVVHTTQKNARRNQEKTRHYRQRCLHDDNTPARFAPNANDVQ
ncbi:integrase catalytic domain-containing protein [Trichonephila clavipes]|nr:integrase catalytic domain-containing protein [Trichonephila clavipes]